MPKENKEYNMNEVGDTEYGLLDLTVELSTRDITAGNEFAIFVLVKNPFTRPVWVREVNVSLPSELKRVDDKEIKQKMQETEQKQKLAQEERQQEYVNLQDKIRDLQAQIRNLEALLDGPNVTDSSLILFEIKNLQSEIRFLGDELQTGLGVTAISIHAGAEVDKLRIGSHKTSLSVHGVDASDQHGQTKVGSIEVYEPWVIYADITKTRTVKLKGSLPDRAALQPSSTAVYTVVLDVKRSLIFTPSKYRLQFYVNYGFSPDVDSSDEVVSKVFTNTIAHELSIRPSVFSVITGSVFGGLIGAIARVLQSSSASTTDFSIVPVILAVILSGVAVIFMARKSDTQSFVSVEDFWGGVLIGFLVGYTGTSFFETVTGITPLA